MSREKPAIEAIGLDSEPSLTNGQLWRRAAAQVLATRFSCYERRKAVYIKADSAERQAKTVEPAAESPADELPVDARKLFNAENEQLVESRHAAGEA